MSMKILLADDSITIQKVIGIIFGGDEYALTVVDNGKAAVEKALEISPDVLLIDALMPGMSGYEVCETIRANPALSAKPILILTGSFEPFDEDKAKGCGADDFLAKPFESQQIVAKVKELYELGESRTSTPTQTEPTPAQTFDIPPVIPVETPIAAEPDQEIKPDDIWGAFTSAPEPEAEVPFQAAMPESAIDSDVFAIVNEEPEVQIVPPQTPPSSPADSPADQWLPVEEQAFEFKEETFAELPSAALSGQAPLEDVSFGEISFEEVQINEPAASITEADSFEVPAAAEFSEPVASFTETIIPAFTEPDVQPYSPSASLVTEPVAEFQAQPVAAASIAPLTEEQLKAAIAGVSQEVIQRIVWEVVPELAETLIKEAIDRIKKGL